MRSLYSILHDGPLVREEILAILKEEGAAYAELSFKKIIDEKNYLIKDEQGRLSYRMFTDTEDMVIDVLWTRGDSSVDDILAVVGYTEPSPRRAIVRAIRSLFDKGAILLHDHDGYYSYTL